MPFTKNRFAHGCWLVLENALRFAFNLAFVTVFQILFGMENILPAVALGVGITVLPFSDFGIRPWAMVCIVPILFIGSGLVAQAAFLHPAIAFVLNFAFVFLLFSLAGEPVKVQPYISFLICFVFCQSTVVPNSRFLPRFNALALGSLLIMATTLFWWKLKGYGKNGRSLKEQILASWTHFDLIFRMSLGLAVAMLVGTLLGLRKPLWISIVVMSLTQLHFHDTVFRIKNRTVGTVIGIIFFIVVFRIFVPAKYANLMILLLGYLSFFTTEYKYKQIVNAVSAINASMILLDTSSAIANRVLCLLGGIVIVLFCYTLTWGAMSLWKKYQDKVRTNHMEDMSDQIVARGQSGQDFIALK